MDEIREVSVENLEVIGKGVTGTIYRLNEDQILKLYATSVPLEDIKKQRNISLSAYEKGIPTAKVYDLVSCNGQYGVIFEYLKTGTLMAAIGTDTYKRMAYGTKMGALLKKLHDTSFEPGSFQSIRDMALGNIKRCQDYLSDGQMQELTDYLERYEKSTHLLHGDFHENNIMVRDGEPVLIDLDSMCEGSPIADFAQMYCSYKMPLPPEIAKKLNITPEITREFLYRILRAYFGDMDDASIQKYDELFTECSKYHRFFFPLLKAKPEQKEDMKKYVEGEFPKLRETMAECTKWMKELGF